MNKKYELIDDDYLCLPNGKVLCRIRALRNLCNGVKVGDIGGYIETESNLSLSDDSWIYDDAMAYGDAYVSDGARVSGEAKVYDTAWVKGTKTEITKKSVVCGDSIVIDSVVTDSSEISGNARVINSIISDRSIITNESVVFNACIRWGHNCGLNERGWGNRYGNNC